MSPYRHAPFRAAMPTPEPAHRKRGKRWSENDIWWVSFLVSIAAAVVGTWQEWEILVMLGVNGLLVTTVALIWSAACKY